MPPKKREKDQEMVKAPPKSEDPQNDKELFLQAFEKPTQIYRFLRTRNLVSPIFLPRSLSYMRQRMSRNHRKRKNFDLDGMLKKIESKLKNDSKGSGLDDFMTLTFTGLQSKDIIDDNNCSVSIEAFLLNYCNKKRKDISSPVTHSLIGKCDIHCSDLDLENSKKSTEAISIPADSFTIPNNGYLLKSCILLLKVTVIPNQTASRLHNGDSLDIPAKRLRRDIDEDEYKKKVFAAELIVSDRHKKCFLTNGDYELILKEYKTKPINPKSSTWETFGNDDSQHITNPFEAFNGSPVLKFQLKWGSKPINGKVNMPCPFALRDRPETRNGLRNKLCEKNKSDDITIKQERKEPEKKIRIFYQFLYNNNTRQQTEAREDMHCPWCSLNCMALYSLLKHLKLCHSRFVFTYTPHSLGARIDVAISECYDGSYAGNPHDLHSLTGFAFSRSGPVCRTPVTNVIVCRPKRPQNSLSEFLEVDDTDDTPLTYVMGHSRLYYHTGSYLPVRPQEIDDDSENENDPLWLKIKTKRMIDDFTDVNEGEKEVMKMWNLHIMQFGFIGDCQIPLACTVFVEKNGNEIWEKNLYGNFILHLTNLHDFGLISAAVLYKTVNTLLLMKGNGTVR